MRFPQIPNIENAWSGVTIDALSPSNFSWVNHGCRYQILLQAVIKSFNNKALLLPSNKNALLGTIIHKLYELTIKGELKSLLDLKNKWEELITAKKTELASQYPTLRCASLNDYDKRNSAIRYAMGMMSRSGVNASNEQGRRVLSEKWLDCSSIGLRGTADKLVLDGGYVDVIDFKSGHVKDDSGGIKTEYRVQLHLYAVMCQYLSFGTPRNLSLVDIEGDYYDIPYSQVFSEQLVYDVQEALKLLNNAIAEKDFGSHAKPELGMCSFCGCRHVCQFRDISAEDYYQTVSGILIDIPSTNMYVLRGSNDVKYYVSGIDVYDIEKPHDYLGKMLTFVNVIRASQQADGFTFKTTENTLVYEQLLNG